MKFLHWLGRVIQAAKILFPKKAKKVEDKIEEVLDETDPKKKPYTQEDQDRDSYIDATEWR